MLSQLGWIDGDGQPINQTMTEDIMSLPQEVSAHLTEDAVGECAMEMVSQWSEDPKHARCADKYTQEEMDRLEEVGMMVANYKCFQYIFKQACKDLVQSQIYQLYSSNVPSTSTAAWPEEPVVENNYVPKGQMIDLDASMKASYFRWTG